MTTWKRISTPLSYDDVSLMHSGDRFLLSGIVYTARDRAHERLRYMVAEGKELPFMPAGQVLYYVGPSPQPRGRIIGAAGPTTSYRMDPFTEVMLKTGIRGMIGKGKRDEKTRSLLQQYGGVYFSSYGGAGAYLAKRITEARVIAFEDLGPEAIYELRVLDFPVIVINDIYGGDLYEDAIRK
ncbi:MAG: fumarate hydratase [Spirochaetae bacterium HGW-Spirochaetae-1]|jgi:fumarate hydratase subunit beta|nr:MAG: fumarate hydratase [Spirochaetae bacterium HGW-Spirochaetae-1]